MTASTNSIILKFDYSCDQSVGEITKVVGLIRAKYLIPIIDCLNLEANPRSSKTGSVTDAIQESIINDSETFPFKTKGILLASSRYERLERGRIRITPDNLGIEGILDGGHNTLAIGLYILQKAMEHCRLSFPKGQKTWSQFKYIWQTNRELIDDYQEAIRKETLKGELNFYVPVELLLPRDPTDLACVESFKNDLLEICDARNNNVQLPVSDKANQRGYYDVLKSLMDEKYPELSNKIAWKTNDGGVIKAQEIVALSWIPLGLISTVKDNNGRIIEPSSPNNIYSVKGSCLKQFEKLMSSPDVTVETSADYKRELKNTEVCSAFKITVELPALYDYIYEMFPQYYNAAGGSYGNIKAVRVLNVKIKDKRTPYGGKLIETVSPDGFIVPLVFGLQALMENREENGSKVIRWKQPPMKFLQDNLEGIVRHYAGIFSMCDYDPQKIGKNQQSYAQALSAFKMAMAGIL